MKTALGMLVLDRLGLDGLRLYAGRARACPWSAARRRPCWPRPACCCASPRRHITLYLARIVGAPSETQLKRPARRKKAAWTICRAAVRLCALYGAELAAIDRGPTEEAAPTPRPVPAARPTAAGWTRTTWELEVEGVAMLAARRADRPQSAARARGTGDGAGIRPEPTRLSSRCCGREGTFVAGGHQDRAWKTAPAARSRSPNLRLPT